MIKEFKFYEIGKEHHTERLQHKLRHDPMLVYHTVLSNSREVTLPLVSKVKKGKLILQNYTLDSGHMLGLACAIKQTKQPVIESILFDNCGIDDNELSILLEGCLEMQSLNHFVYKNNILMNQGLQALKPILLRPSPYNLKELRLVNCDTSELLMEELIDFIVTENVQLRSLSLVRMRVTRLCIEEISGLVQK